MNINNNEKKNNLSGPPTSNEDRDNRAKEEKRKQNLMGTELDFSNLFMKMIKAILKFLPLGLGFYDELSDILYYNTAKFVDQELKNFFLFFIFLSPTI